MLRLSLGPAVRAITHGIPIFRGSRSVREYASVRGWVSGQSRPVSLQCLSPILRHDDEWFVTLQRPSPLLICLHRSFARNLKLLMSRMSSHLIQGCAETMTLFRSSHSSSDRLEARPLRR